MMAARRPAQRPDCHRQKLRLIKAQSTASTPKDGAWCGKYRRRLGQDARPATHRRTEIPGDWAPLDWQARVIAGCREERSGEA